jgi:hypothetical protein
MQGKIITVRLDEDLYTLLVDYATTHYLKTSSFARSILSEGIRMKLKPKTQAQ